MNNLDSTFDCRYCGYRFRDESRINKVWAECPHCQRLEGRLSTMISLSSPTIVHNTYAWKRDLDRDNHRMDLIQPTTHNGELNPDFEKAYGYNPYKEEAIPYKKQKEAIKSLSTETSTE